MVNSAVEIIDPKFLNLYICIHCNKALLQCYIFGNAGLETHAHRPRSHNELDIKNKCLFLNWLPSPKPSKSEKDILHQTHS